MTINIFIYNKCFPINLAAYFNLLKTIEVITYKDVIKSHLT